MPEYLNPQTQSLNPQISEKSIELCFGNRLRPKDANADMVGIAVNVANVVLCFCLRILVTWSTEEIDIGVQGCIFQIYSILISTALSINRNELNVFDASFALTVSSSPLTLYLVISSIGDLFGFKNGLYKRIKHRHFVRPFLVLVPFIWLGLSLTLRFSNHAFKGSEGCAHSTFSDWFQDLGMFFTMTYIKYKALGGQITLPLIASIFLLCLFRRRSLVRENVRSHWTEVSNPWRRLISTPWVLVRGAWCAISRNHSWCIYLLYYYLDLTWAIDVMDFASQASSKMDYKVTYGQLLAVFAIIPTLISTLKVVYSLRGTVEPSHFHYSVLAEIKYLAAGIEPEPTAQQYHLPQYADQFSGMPSESCLPMEEDPMLELGRPEPLIHGQSYQPNQNRATI